MADSEDPLGMRLTFQIAAIGIGAVVFSFLVALFVFVDSDQPGHIIVAVLGPSLESSVPSPGMWAARRPEPQAKSDSSKAVRRPKTGRQRRNSS